MWNGVVTNVGIALLAQWAGGGNLVIDGASTGTGTVAVAQLMSCTDVAGTSHAASIIEYKEISQGLKYLVQINAAPSAYVAMQIGVWAKLNGGARTLIAIFQADSESGISVPSTADMADFAFTFGASVIMDNTGTFTVTVDPDTFVTNDRFTEAQDEQKLLMPDVPECTATPTFDSSGNLTTITHVSTISGNTIRTDTFTIGSTSVVETRTLANGKTLTITTNLTTKATTLAFGTTT